jgi:hypothetical protein
MSATQMPKAKRKAIQVEWTINMANCIHAISGLLLVLHQINLL